MTPELQTYLTYAALVLAGYFLRSRGIVLPFLPGPSPAPTATPSAPAVPELNNPLVQGLLVLLKQILEKQPEPAPAKQ